MANAELHASNKILRGLSHPGYSPAEDAIRHKLQVASGCPEAFLAARRVFAASLAASSISGWIVGLGDRHCENILLDVSHGSLVHVDFGYAFGTGTLTLPIPEIVPFRATRTFLGALKPLDAREWLETDMEVLTALRSGKNLLEDHGHFHPGPNFRLDPRNSKGRRCGKARRNESHARALEIVSR